MKKRKKKVAKNNFSTYYKVEEVKAQSLKAWLRQSFSSGDLIEVLVNKHIVALHSEKKSVMYILDLNIKELE